MRFEGVIKSWNDDRGFGFIEPTQGGQEVFVHVKAFTRRSGRPQINQLVSFEVELGPQGKKRARNVEPVRTVRSASRVRRNATAPWGTATLFTIPAFLVLYLTVSVLWKPPPWVAAVYVTVSLFTFVAYAADKAAAERGGWRTPEGTLHALSLAGGWPGALLAQQFQRHKSTKAEFRSTFWGTVVVNVIVFLLLCSPAGRSWWAVL
jgi:uncharacterized membrane protein YsdA (DUF1294 family)/cold shock CspA family protein